jgi:hypothetical protein
VVLELSSSCLNSNPLLPTACSVHHNHCHCNTRRTEEEGRNPGLTRSTSMPHLVRLLSSIKIQTPAEPHEFIIPHLVLAYMHVIDRIQSPRQTQAQESSPWPARRVRGALAGMLECHSASAPANSPTPNRIAGGRGRPCLGHGMAVAPVRHSSQDQRDRRRAPYFLAVRFSSDFRHGVGRGTRV